MLNVTMFMLLFFSVFGAAGIDLFGGLMTCAPAAHNIMTSVQRYPRTILSTLGTSSYRLSY